MQHITAYYYLFAFMILCGLGCATQGRPNGGPKDTKPPQVVDKESSANYQTSYTDREFELIFDEFIKISNVTKEVLISPPMLNFPEITSRGKKLTVKFNPKEIIKENATYTFNFGESIADFTEGNKLQNYSFVFATGDKIDSLSISGSVQDFKTDKALEKIVILLYDNLDDSIVYKERPFYFARTDDQGAFVLNNIKSDTFQIIALDDQNLNYIYNPESESIAFIDSSFVLTDSSDLNINFKLSSRVAPLAVENKNSDEYGKIDFKLNKSVSSLDYEILDSIDHFDILSQDSLHIWYKNFRDSTIHINILGDSLSIRLRKYALDTLKNRPYLTATNANEKNPLAPDQDCHLIWSTPIKSIHKSGISIVDTSGSEISFEYQIDTTDQRILRLQSDWKDNETYTVRINPMSIDNFYDIQNDSIQINIYVSELSKFGKLFPNLIHLDSTVQYVIRLLQRDKLIDTEIIHGVEQKRLEFTNLKPGKYILQIIEDRNKNKQWDSANFSTKSQAEPFAEIELPDLRANWEDDSEFDISKILKK